MFTSILDENQCHESVFFRYYWHICTLYYTELNTETTVFGLKRSLQRNENKTSRYRIKFSITSDVAYRDNKF